MTRLYKKIPWDNLPEIQRKTIEYFKAKRPEILNREGDCSFWTMRDQEILSIVPEIQEGAAKYGLVCNFTGAFVMHKPGDGPLHLDGYHHRARISFPILNTKHTYTEFYSGTEGVRYYSDNNSSEGTTITIKTDENTKFLGAVQIDQVTVMQVNVAHTVKMFRNAPSPRIILTLGFDKDPYFLLEDDSIISPS
jgi:hypothetical protein